MIIEEHEKVYLDHRIEEYLERLDRALMMLKVTAMDDTHFELISEMMNTWHRIANSDAPYCVRDYNNDLVLRGFDYIKGFNEQWQEYRRKAGIGNATSK